MIHLFIGTKAQLIKMAPILHELERRDVPFNYIDAGQHAALSARLRQQLSLPPPNATLRDKQNNISTIPQAFGWVLRLIWQLLFRRGKIFREIFREQRGVCLIHGDTLTTLISLFFAKRCGIPVAHVEAGLRSYRLLDPFPEELIRLVAMRYSDILFAPSQWALNNLTKMGHAQKTVLIEGNTVFDTVAYAKNNLSEKYDAPNPYVVVTIHRVETIYVKKRLEQIIALLARLARTRTVLFVQHEPTQNQLRKFGLDVQLAAIDHVRLLPLQPYLTFIGLLAGADFVLTDGGSIQEECHVLNVPCLIMRSSTERMEGLGGNAVLAGFDDAKIEQFLRELPNLRRERPLTSGQPSKKIVDYLIGLSL